MLEISTACFIYTVIDIVLLNIFLATSWDDVLGISFIAIPIVPGINSIIETLGGGTIIHVIHILMYSLLLISILYPILRCLNPKSEYSKLKIYIKQNNNYKFLEELEKITGIGYISCVESIYKNKAKDFIQNNYIDNIFRYIILIDKEKITYSLFIDVSRPKICNKSLNDVLKEIKYTRKWYKY